MSGGVAPRSVFARTRLSVRYFSAHSRKRQPCALSWQTLQPQLWLKSTSFIMAVYEDLFNRTPDAGGLGYWQNQLEANLANPQAVGSFVLDVIFGAQGSDQTTIADKVTVADYFTMGEHVGVF